MVSGTFQDIQEGKPTGILSERYCLPNQLMF